MTSVVTSAHSAGARLRGDLSLDSPAAVVPLRGPGQWTLTTSRAVATTLLCGSHSSDVVNTVRVSTNQTCQLDITVTTGAPTAWTLTPIQ
ncbi:MAG TPA: hypothetical protein VIJ86_02120 [Acidimicrobiales bacterium]